MAQASRSSATPAARPQSQLGRRGPDLGWVLDVRAATGCWGCAGEPDVSDILRWLRIGTAVDAVVRFNIRQAAAVASITFDLPWLWPWCLA